MDDDADDAPGTRAQEPRLKAVAYRLLGSFDEAEEAVEQAIRDAPRHPAPTTGDPFLAALTRICLERLRARETHRTAPWDPWDPWDADRAGPEGRALLAAMDSLTPPERLAFVLHDLFDVPYEEIAATLERTQAAARHLAGRARHRVQGTEEMPEPDPARQREVVAAFLAASRTGDSKAMLALLDPDVALRADPTAVRTGARAAHGAVPVALALAGRTREARQALVDGAAGLVLTREGRPRTVFAFTVLDGRITSVDVLADEGHLGRLTVRPLAERTAPF
ncbi:sigma factor-like helix-turn-helix DNA-binding protein [Streptomyces stackebrandtii]|uniref:sigma factor-like helix-turn-helix DNA-binding protein n=1 Tax=Streptomyces stackebrandtii TaxID=3051177 RepID=UPI0028DB194A|nr:sigma factor-like helix-turn-helix DNA-binding protein [Streptomyces sp. DSM 40976]